MSAKTCSLRKAAFLKALAETGNQTIAAERAKVSRSWVCKHRGECPEFDAACREAIAAAETRLGAHPEKRPPSGWGYLDGEELVVKGTGGSGGGKRVQIARARVNQISPRVETRFLAVLAATCNVKAACSAAGVSKGAIYTHRKRWPGFARRWRETVEVGYALLELGLVRYAMNLFSSPALPAPAEDVPEPAIEERLHSLYMHGHAVHRMGRKPGRDPRPPDVDEALRVIAGKLDTIEKGESLSEEAKARAEEEWARRRAA